jgi:hypothetical protein
MTATNHVLTGMLIGASLSNPLFALPAAFVSHFILDSLPHYGDEYVGYNDFKFKFILGTDAYIALMCLLLVLMLNPANVLLILTCGVLAASPDLMWLPDFIAALRHQPKPVYGSLRKAHSVVQWYQRPKGLYIEAVWFVASFILLFYTI